MQNCAFGYQNAVLAGTVTADQQVAALPVTNLQQDQGSPATAWRALGNAATLTLKLPAATPLQAFSLHRTNLTASCGWWIEVSRGGSVVFTWGIASANKPAGVAMGQCVYVAPAPVLGDQVRIGIYDANNGDGYLSLPLCYIGPIWQPIRNMSYDTDEDTENGTDEITALDGTEYPALRWWRRVVNVDHKSLDPTEMPTLRGLAQVGLSTRNVLFLPDPSAATLNSAALFGRLTPSAISSPSGPWRRATKMTLKERI